MKIIEIANLDKTCYQETLKNGLEVYMITYEDKKNYFISYATKYGSDILSFEVDGKLYTPPLGIAHYLEHKLFEEESGEDPFTFFSRSGTDANASTSYDNTQYICLGTKNFKENLKYLLTFVNHPFFTDKNVEKEKGIISEEIKMYQDIPDYKLEMTLRENIYHNSSRKYDIAGTIKEIKKITKEDLYKCYESFYIPSNMFILITGNFKIEEALEIIKETLEEKEGKLLPKIMIPKEPKEVVKKEETIYENIEVPKIGYAIKVPKSSLNKKGVERDLYLNMITTILFGSSSEFQERMRQKKILNDYDMQWEEEHSYKTFYFFATTTSPEELIHEIDYEWEHLALSKANIDRMKKVWIANEGKMIDHIEKTQANFFDDIIEYQKIIENRVPLIRKITKKGLEEFLEKIDLSNRSILKMLKKEEKE